MIIGILQRATDAKEQTEIGQEKEIVALAYNSALSKKVSNGDSTAVNKDDMNTELTNQGANATGSNPIKVTFTDSKRQYTINSNGIIEYAGIQSEEETVTTTNIYATVCANGTLVFSHNEDDINKYLTDNSTSIASGYSIENITDNIYYWNSDEDNLVPFWLDSSSDNVINIYIINSIVPKNTMKVNCWFSGLSNLTSINNLDKLNTINVTDMSYMFCDCSNLTNLDLSNFDTSNVTNMERNVL